MIIENIFVRKPVRALDTLNLPLPGLLLGSGALHVSLLVTPELERKGKQFATGRTGVFGNIGGDLAVLAGQVILQVVLLHKLLLTDLTLEMSLSTVCQEVLLQTSLLGKRFFTDVTRERLVIIMLPHVLF